jgi:esterase/lipase superfamily enzyme
MTSARFRISLSLVSILLLTGCVGGRTLIPTPAIYETSRIGLLSDLTQIRQRDRIDVLYATDRQPERDASDELVGYGSGRSASLALGEVRVDIEDRTNGSGSSARPRIELVGVDELVRFPRTPYLYRAGERGRIEIDRETVAALGQAEDGAKQAIRKRLALTPRKEVFLDVHGVAAGFDDAVLDLASFWHFLGREGVPIAYTWPAGSKGVLFYTVDRESGEFTVLHLKEFLRLLVAMPEVERIHISAHSRGTDVVVTSLRELIIETRAKGLDPREHLKIENLVLAAADIDLDIDMQRIEGEAMTPAFGRVTLYINTRDRALAAARGLFKSGQRLGSLDLTELSERQRELVRRADNLDIIAYDGKGGGLFRHGYYDDPAVSADIIMLLRYGWRPGEGERHGLERLGENTWRIDTAHWDEVMR